MNAARTRLLALAITTQVLTGRAIAYSAARTAQARSDERGEIPAWVLIIFGTVLIVGVIYVAFSGWVNTQISNILNQNTVQ